MSNRTSLIIDPEDVRLPALTPLGQKIRAEIEAEEASRTIGKETIYNSWTDHSLYTRCFARPIPRIGQAYNHGVQILQMPGYVAIHYESMHDVRIIPLDGRPHAHPNIRLLNGDSRGRWEGNTLVVDSTNFSDKERFGPAWVNGDGWEGLPQGNMRFTERFTKIDANTIENAANTGLEVSQNSFARIINNTIEHSGQNGIFVLGSSSAHIGVVSTGDKVPQPNVIQNNRGDGIQVLRASTARIIGNIISGNQRNGLTVQQASHADVAGNTFNRNLLHGIRVVGNSGVNLADSAMRVIEQPNTTTAPNGMFGIRCEIGAYVEGPLGSLMGSSGVKDMSDTSCIDRTSP